MLENNGTGNKKREWVGSRWKNIKCLGKLNYANSRVSKKNCRQVSKKGVKFQTFFAIYFAFEKAIQNLDQDLR